MAVKHINAKEESGILLSGSDATKVFSKIYIKNLMEKGYIPADDFSKQALPAKGIIIAK